MEVCETKLEEKTIAWNKTRSRGTFVNIQTKIDTSDPSKCSENFWNHTWFGGSWRFPEQKIIAKAKISPKLTWAVAVNHSLGSYGTYSVGMEMK